jgi:hypothetical protein
MEIGIVVVVAVAVVAVAAVVEEPVYSCFLEDPPWALCRAAMSCDNVDDAASLNQILLLRLKFEKWNRTMDGSEGAVRKLQ